MKKISTYLSTDDGNDQSPIWQTVIETTGGVALLDLSKRVLPESVITLQPREGFAICGIGFRRLRGEAWWFADHEEASNYFHHNFAANN